MEYIDLLEYIAAQLDKLIHNTEKLKKDVELINGGFEELKDGQKKLNCSLSEIDTMCQAALDSSLKQSCNLSNIEKMLKNNNEKLLALLNGNSTQGA